MIVEVVTEVIVVDSVVDTLVILKSVVKVADVLEIAREKSLFAHSVAQHQRSQSMKLVQNVQHVQIVQFVQNAQ
jgi:hypothetical protein